MIDLDVTLPLSGFPLEIRTRLEGQAVAILGPSGSGKTSLLETIAGLRRRTAGRIGLDGEVLLDSSRRICLAPERRRIGYLPQDSLLFPHLDVADNVRFGIGADAESQRRFQESIEILEVGALLERYPATLSGGERQRVALARALATRPRLLLLDEPLAAVDIELKSRILPYLLRIRDEWRIPFLYVTHNAGEAESLAEEAILLRQGRVATHGPTREVTRSLSAVDPFARFDNVLDGTLGAADETAGVAPLRLSTGSTLYVPTAVARAGERSVFSVAPDEILLSVQPLLRISARNVLAGEVLAVEPSGNEAMIRVEAAGLVWRAHVTAAAVRDLQLAPGLPVWLAIKAQSFRRFG